MISISIKKSFVEKVETLFEKTPGTLMVLVLSSACSLIAIIYCFLHNYIVIYGDAESHLNIAKRVFDGLTPGFAQLGGIWLPIPHLLMTPFVQSDFLWRSGLAGSIVSGTAYVIASIYIYKTSQLIIRNKLASLVTTLVFMFNPNVLYMQSTPMTELLLICFFILSSYFFIKFLFQKKPIISLIQAGFFGFCAVLTRYDGWFLVAFEAMIIVLYHIPWSQTLFKIKNIILFFRSKLFQEMEGRVVIFCSLAFFGIFLWLLWGFLILGDPLYFTHSEFSASSQQQAWLARGNLPAYHNIWISFIYYFVTAMSNAGVIIYFSALLGIAYYIYDRKADHRFFILLLLAVPFIFNVITLFLGQSVIFIPHLTPANWDHNLFNVRYGLMTVPLVAFAFGYLFHRSKTGGKILLIGLFLFQFVLYGVGYSKIISFQDGYEGLSSETAKIPDAQQWITRNYDAGLILMDDFSRTISIVHTHIPMRSFIYIGNKPYWEESLREPEKYATWIIMQKGDSVWNEIWEKPEMQDRLYTYFNKVYTSDTILIFKKIPGR